jgi:hypothetical protein
LNDLFLLDHFLTKKWEARNTQQTWFFPEARGQDRGVLTINLAVTLKTIPRVSKIYALKDSTHKQNVCLRIPRVSKIYTSKDSTHKQDDMPLSGQKILHSHGPPQGTKA